MISGGRPAAPHALPAAGLRVSRAAGPLCVAPVSEPVELVAASSGCAVESGCGSLDRRLDVSAGFKHRLKGDEHDDACDRHF